MSAQDTHSPEDWREAANCRGKNTEHFLREYDTAARYCEHCPSRELCLAEALRFRREQGVQPVGIWGGLTEAQRERLHQPARCDYCGVPFTPVKSHQRLCSPCSADFRKMTNGKRRALLGRAS